MLSQCGDARGPGWRAADRGLHQCRSAPGFAASAALATAGFLLAPSALAASRPVMLVVNRVQAPLSLPQGCLARAVAGSALASRRIRGSSQQRRVPRGAARPVRRKLGNRNAKLGNAPDPERGGRAIASQCKERKRSGLTPAAASREAGEGEPFNEHHQEPEPAGSRAGEPGGHRGELRQQRLGVDVDDPGGGSGEPGRGPPLRSPWSAPWSWGACRAGRSPRSRSRPRWSRRSRRCWSSGAARPAAGRSARCSRSGAGL